MPADYSTFPPETGGFAPRHHRTVLFYGQEAFARIQAAQVTVVGLGGVGGHAAVNLARSGIGGLHLVDFDHVTESSLNRSAFAGPQDVGRPKTQVLAEYLGRVCPQTRVRLTEAFASGDNAPDILPAGSGLCLDAIDSLDAKVALIAHCVRLGLPVLASMGAAGKRDAGLVRTGDLADSTVCPLARRVRVRLKSLGIGRGVAAVWSVETGDATRPAAPGESGGAAASLTGDGGRRRPTLASQMTIPGVFGYALAAMALDLIAAGSGPRP